MDIPTDLSNVSARTLRMVTAVPVLAGIAVSALLVWQLGDSVAVIRRAERTDRFISESNLILGMVSDSETEICGSLVSQDPQYVERWNRTRGRMFGRFAALSVALVQDVSTNSAAIAPIARDMIAANRSTSTAFESSSSGSPVELLGALAGAHAIIEHLRVDLVALVQRESVLRREQVRQAHSRTVTLNVFCVAVALFTTLFLAIHGRAQTSAIKRTLERIVASERAARATADTANCLKDELIATISHEIKTPLTAVIGWVRVLEDGSVDEGRRKRAIAAIERNAAAQLQLIEDLLDFSRIGLGKLRFAFEPFDPAEAASTMIEALRPTAENKQIQIETKLDVGGRTIRGDRRRFGQVIANLMTNAIKFTERRGRIAVRLSYTPDAVVLIVEDTGIGIPSDVLPRVFEKFEQGDRSPMDSSHGLGLGLAIVRDIVLAHGGSVEARSAGIGKGTSIIVRLPAPQIDVRNDEPLRVHVP